MCPIFFTHSSVDGYLGCFYILAIVNSAAVNIGMHVSYQISVFAWIYTKEWNCWIILYFYLFIYSIFIYLFIWLHRHLSCGRRAP